MYLQMRKYAQAAHKAQEKAVSLGAGNTNKNT